MGWFALTFLESPCAVIPESIRNLFQVRGGRRTFLKELSMAIVFVFSRKNWREKMGRLHQEFFFLIYAALER